MCVEKIRSILNQGESGMRVGGIGKRFWVLREGEELISRRRKGGP